MSFLSSKKFRQFWKPIKYLVAIAALYWVFKSVEWRLFFQTVRNFEAWLLIPITVLYLLGIWLSCWRWQFILRSLDIQVHIKELLKLYFVGNFYNTFLPSSVGGDVVKVLKMDKSLSRKKIALSVLLDRVYGLVTSLFFSAVIGILYFFSIERINEVLITSIVILLTLGGFVSFVLFQNAWRNILDFIDSSIKIPFMYKITGQLRKLIVYLPKSLLSIFYSVPFVLSIFISQYLLFRAAHTDVSLLEIAFANPVISLIAMIPISINALGLKEGAYSFFYALFGVTSAQAVAVSIVGRALLLIYSLIGLLFL